MLDHHVKGQPDSLTNVTQFVIHPVLYVHRLLMDSLKQVPKVHYLFFCSGTSILTLTLMSNRFQTKVTFCELLLIPSAAQCLEHLFRGHQALMKEATLAGNDSNKGIPPPETAAAFVHWRTVRRRGQDLRERMKVLARTTKAASRKEGRKGPLPLPLPLARLHRAADSINRGHEMSLWELQQ